MFVLSRGAANGDVLKCSALTGLLITLYEPPRDFKASNIGPIGLAWPASPIGPMSGGGGGTDIRPTPPHPPPQAGRSNHNLAVSSPAIWNNK